MSAGFGSLVETIRMAQPGTMTMAELQTLLAADKLERKFMPFVEERNTVAIHVWFRA